MSWVRIWVHLVFTTKKRAPFLKDGIRQKLMQHIRENAAAKGIRLDCVNGYTDHVHCLFLLDKEMTVSKVAQLIKGESSFWINQNKLTPSRFLWQDDYWAAGVSETHLNRVRQYILNQEDHHRKKPSKKKRSLSCKNTDCSLLSKNGTEIDLLNVILHSQYYPTWHEHRERPQFPGRDRPG